MVVKKVSNSKIVITCTESDLIENEIDIDDLMNNQFPSQKLMSLITKQVESVEMPKSFSQSPSVIELCMLPNKSLQVSVAKLSEKNGFNPFNHIFGQCFGESTDDNEIDCDEYMDDDDLETQLDDNPAFDLSSDYEISDIEGSSNQENLAMAAFSDIDDMIDFARILPFICESSVYKEDKSKEYLFVVKTSSDNKDIFNNLASEYGKIISLPLVKILYMKEHNQTFIRENAIENLKKIK